MKTKINLLEVLKEKKCSLVVGKEHLVRVYYGKGISDLLSILYSNPEFLQGAVVADKIVGKGAASLLVMEGIAVLHTVVISVAALEMLRKTSIKVFYQMEVPYIINNKGDGICMIEQLCRPYSTATDCVERIKTFMNKTKI